MRSREARRRGRRGYVDIFDPGGTQSYNGLVLSVQHRFSKGLTTNANYT
jgi:hypothetical protein